MSDNHQNWPAGELARILAPYRGTRARVCALKDDRGRPLGNHGDALMHHAFWKRLPELAITPVDDQPQILVIPPNGALLDSYGAPALIAKWLASQPDLPVIIFPSSALFVSSDPAEMFGQKRAGAVWVLREARSFEHLTSNWFHSLRRKGVELALDHDMVVTGRAHVLDLLGGPAEPRDPQESPLLVARLGVESTDMRSAVKPSISLKRRVSVSAYSSLPEGPTKRAIRRRVTRASQLSANDRMLASLPDAMTKKLGGSDTANWFDISDPTLTDFDGFRSRLTNASMVVTNRLHVALPSASLGLKTVLVESGYHKLRGVYERSMTDVDNLTFVRAPGW